MGCLKRAFTTSLTIFGAALTERLSDALSNRPGTESASRWPGDVTIGHDLLPISAPLCSQGGGVRGRPASRKKTKTSRKTKTSPKTCEESIMKTKTAADLSSQHDE